MIQLSVCQMSIPLGGLDITMPGQLLGQLEIVRLAIQCTEKSINFFHTSRVCKSSNGARDKRNGAFRLVPFLRNEGTQSKSLQCHDNLVPLYTRGTSARCLVVRLRQRIQFA